MTVEKIPHLAANGANNAKSGGGVKNDRGAQGAADGNGMAGVFGALLTSLAVDDVAPSADAGPVSQAPDDQSIADASAAGTLFGVFVPTVQSPAVLSTGGGKDDVEISSIQNIQVQVASALVLDSGGLMAADVLPSAALAGAKLVSAPIGQSDLSEMPDALGQGNFAAKAARLQKEPGRAESASPVGPVRIAAVIGADPGKLELRVAGERADALGMALAQVASELLPLEASQQTEFRRDKAIFKANSTNESSGVGLASSLDGRPPSLSLEGTAQDVGAGMTQGDQNPGTYWMSGDMKNAEMKLEGFGESPVEVSISVHGNQTHVAFRTDEMQTRLALEDAGATLKDMLSKEGLDLAGVSVGTSGSGGNGAQDRRTPPDSRPARIDNLTSKFPAGTSGHIGKLRTGALDVFV